jgi:hypothetical protein
MAQRVLCANTFLMKSNFIILIVSIQVEAFIQFLLLFYLDTVSVFNAFLYFRTRFPK